jgi:hypothetical protein
MRPNPSTPATLPPTGSMQPDLPFLRERHFDLNLLAKRLEADIILLTGDRDAALREISQLRLLLVRALPAVDSRAKRDGDTAARQLLADIRSALRT